MNLLKGLTTSLVAPKPPSEKPLAASLPEFRVDFLVHQDPSSATSYFRRASPASSHVWRQFIVRGQQLVVAGTSKPLLTLETPHATLEPVSGNEFRLHANKSPILTLFCPSATRLSKFQAVLQLSALTPYWVLSPQTAFEALVDVATAIVETHQANAPPSVTLPAKHPTLSSVDTTIVNEDANEPEPEEACVTAADVAAYLAHCKPVYDHLLTLSTKADVHAYLVQLQTDYAADRAHVLNFAHFVHRQHCMEYTDAAKSSWAPPALDYSVCPHAICRQPLDADAAFDIRFTGAAVPCSHCGHPITAEDIQYTSVARDHPELTFHTTVGTPLRRLPPGQGTYWNYTKLMLNTAMQMQAVGSTPLADIDKAALTQLLTDVMIDQLDLVAAMARHLLFVSQVCSQYDYWSHPTVLEASVVRYHQFRQLEATHPTKTLMPTMDIALVHFAHQAQSSSPSLPLDVPDARSHKKTMAGYVETFRLWADTFHDAYSSVCPPSKGGVKARLVHSLAQVAKSPPPRYPSVDCWFVGVDEVLPWDLHQPVNGLINEDRNGQASEPSTTTNTFVAVLGTPLMESRVRLPRHVAILGQHRGGAFFGWTPWMANQMFDDMDYAIVVGARMSMVAART
ncbi:Aste57867_9494 [Aphanomyces stellatus]|uniref:Aste57867_9494 protein n=1 Tax=Aphanomyces stellatus TaxID=120398 RepID=A0A485KNC3_9STRA|nr:hypothetical protein As57867_009457 [Aphanomyces stellatus]VFT86373.1 Aste57867_9494 [Aphanomyces stellatus]